MGGEYGLSLGSYAAITVSSYFGMVKNYTEYYLGDSPFFRLGCGFQLRYPAQLDFVTLVPYAGISGGLAVDSYSMGDSSSSILYTQAEAGLQVGFASGLYLGTAYRMYIDIPSDFPASSLVLLLGFGL